MTNMYGFDSTDEIEYDKAGLPIGTYKAMITDEEEDAQGRGFIATFEALDGEHRGKSGKVWFLTKHENAQTANIAKQKVKRIADATGKTVTPAQPLKGRVLTIEVRQQKKNPDYTEIARFLPENHVVDDIPF